MPKPSPAPIGISQADMERFQQLQADRDEVGKQYENLRQELITKLRASAPIQDGLLTAELDISHPRRPEWKEAYIAANGQAAADQVIAETEEGTVYQVDVHRSRFAR